MDPNSQHKQAYLSNQTLSAYMSNCSAVILGKALTGNGKQLAGCCFWQAWEFDSGARVQLLGSDTSSIPTDIFVSTLFSHIYSTNKHITSPMFL